MADIIQIRRDSAADWTSANPVLADGEIGLEQDTQKIKVGDGVTSWNSLPYWFELASVAWGTITGTLSDQTDLQSALDGKADTVHTHVESEITDLDKYTQAEVDALLATLDEGWVVSATAPSSPPDGKGWYNTTDGYLYIWNNDLAKWLSVDREILVFNRGGSVENGYLKIGEALNAEASYPMLRNATIIGIVASATGGYQDKEFQLRDDGIPIITFNLSNYNYKNGAADIDLTINSKLQAYATDESGGPSSWWDTDYLYRKSFVIDHTKIPGTVNLTNFILSLDVTDGDLTKALANGYDLVFTLSDDATVLDYERVSWNQSTGRLVAHVKVPTVLYDQDTTIRLYYGNAAAASDPTDAAGCWSDYAAVWHFQGDPVGASPQLPDATGNGNNGLENGMDASDLVSGRFGNAWDFTNAGGDWVEIVDATLGTQINGASQLQIMCLFNLKVLPHTDDAPFYLRGGSDPQVMLGLDGGSNPARINSRLDMSSGYERHDDGGVSTGWHVAHLRLSGGRKYAYQDGSEITDVAAAGTIDSYTTNGSGDDHRIGRRAFGDTRGLEDVELDELRIRKTATTPEYIEAESNNLLNQSTFFTVTLEESVTDLRTTENPIVQVILAWRQ